MKVSKTCWHYRAYKIAVVTEEELQKPVSVCAYWATIFGQLPLMCVVFCVALPFLPLFWLGEKISTKLKLKYRSLCPLGKVEFD